MPGHSVEPTTALPRIILFGDSITQGSFDSVSPWGSLLANRYQRRADAVNRGFSGYNSRWALHILPSVFPASDDIPPLVTIFFGANDASLATEDSKRQHVPVEEYRENLSTAAPPRTHHEARSPALLPLSVSGPLVSVITAAALGRQNI